MGFRDTGAGETPLGSWMWPCPFLCCAVPPRDADPSFQPCPFRPSSASAQPRACPLPSPSCRISTKARSKGCIPSAELTGCGFSGAGSFPTAVLLQVPAGSGALQGAEVPGAVIAPSCSSARSCVLSLPPSSRHVWPPVPQLAPATAAPSLRGRCARFDSCILSPQ